MDVGFVRAALERHERALIGYARRITGDLDAARDAVQDTFVSLWSQDQAAVADGLARWLYTVCRRKALDRIRRERSMRAREHMAESAEPPPGPTREVETRDQVSFLRRYVEMLPEKQREAIRLRFQGGLSYREISQVMDESEGHVGWLLHQGLKSLRERVLAREARS